MTSLLITGGRVVDPASGRDEICDIAVQDGVIAAIGTGLGGAEHGIDAAGLVVAPGFIDLHAHGQCHGRPIACRRSTASPPHWSSRLGVHAGGVAGTTSQAAQAGRLLNFGASAVNWVVCAHRRHDRRQRGIPGYDRRDGPRHARPALGGR